jgi:hypothetical protein
VARTALVLVETAPGKAIDIVNVIKHTDGVKAIHMVSDSYGAIALVEASDSDGIRDIASRIALTSGVVRCVVCSEREFTGVETNGFEGIMDDDYICWCVKEPAGNNLLSSCLHSGQRSEKARISEDRGGDWNVKESLRVD